MIAKLTNAAASLPELRLALCAGSWLAQQRAGLAAAATQPPDTQQAHHRAPQQPQQQQRKELVPVQPPAPSLASRLLDSVAEGLHKLVLLVGTLRHWGVNEAYVANYLREQAGLDHWSLEYLRVARPQMFRLSVGREIEPALSWLRSLGLSGEALRQLLVHSPGILGQPVDEQLAPVAAWVESLGVDPAAVLRRCPGLAEVPVAHLKGTRHVLRQLGVPDGDLQPLLTHFPDLVAQLATTLHALFARYGKLGWKLRRGRRRHQHPQPQQEQEQQAAHGGGPAGAAGPAAGAGGGGAAAAAIAGAAGREDPAERTTLLLEGEVQAALQRLPPALAAVAVHPPGSEEQEVALGELQRTIDALGVLPGGQQAGAAAAPGGASEGLAASN